MLTLFWARYTFVVDVVPKFVPVIVKDDFRIGEDEVLESEVIDGDIDGL